MQTDIDDLRAGERVAAGADIPHVEIEPQKLAFFHTRPIKSAFDETTDPEPPHRHNFQEIIWIEAGRGRHTIDNEVLEVEPNTFYLITQGQVHRFIHGRNLVGRIVQFTNNFLLDLPVDQTWFFRTSLFGAVDHDHTLRIGLDQLPEFKVVLDQLTREYEKDSDFGKYEIIRHLLNILLIKLQRVKNSQAGRRRQSYTSEQAIYLEFVKRLEDNYKVAHRVSEYAAMLHVTARRLSGATKRFTGQTAKEVVSQRLALEAQRYLAYTALSVKEIAFALGFSDPSYFSKSFKQVVRVSPQEFRESLRSTGSKISKIPGSDSPIAGG